MTTAFGWAAPEAIQNALTTELNALANGSYTAASAAIDNEAGLYQFMDVWLHLVSLTPVAGQAIGLYLLPSLDSGTTYQDGGAAVVPPAESVIWAFSLTATATAKERVGVNILIPPLKFKLVVGNLTITSGVALAATLNTLKYRRHNGQGV